MGMCSGVMLWVMHGALCMILVSEGEPTLGPKPGLFWGGKVVSCNSVVTTSLCWGFLVLGGWWEAKNSFICHRKGAEA